MRRYLLNIVAHYGLTNKQHTSIDFDLIEARINEYFSKAHSFYLNGVKANLLDYNFYHSIFFVLLEKAKDSDCIKNDFESKFAYYIVKHALTERDGLVRKFFENNPIGSYCGLLKLVLGDKYIDQAHIEEEVHEGTNSSVPTDMHNQTYQECVDSLHKQNVGQGLLLQSSVPDKVYSLIARFVNNLRLFDSWVSAEDVKDFCYCRKQVCLKMTRNSNVAFLLHQLSQRSLIKSEWASIVTSTRMLVSSTGKVMDDAHNLTSSACRVAGKSFDSLNVKERRIFEFVARWKSHSALTLLAKQDCSPWP